MSQEANPYLPPSSEVATADLSESLALEPAGKGRRFGTLVIDYICYVTLSAVLGFLTAALFGDSGVRVLKQIPNILLGVVILSLYYVFFEGLWARTPGKWLFGTVVVGSDGRQPSIKQVLGRTACRFIPFEAFSFLGSTGWHDSIPKTMVVRSTRLP